MGRVKTEKIRITPERVMRTSEGVVLTQDILDEYVEQLRLQGRREDSVRNTETNLLQFYDFLSEDKIISRDCISQWRNWLSEEGYAVRTINSKVSLINSLLESMDCREYQLPGQLVAEEYQAPELTRQEYIRMLQTAKVLEDQRSYLLTKLFATTGLAVIDLPRVTVEAVKNGSMQIQTGNKVRLLRFPDCIQKDLLDYASMNGLISGTIFTKKNGEALARTQVSLYIQRLAVYAKIPAEKGNISCLRQLYRSTISGIEANFDLLVQQAYARQLEMEQLRVGWDD